MPGIKEGATYIQVTEEILQGVLERHPGALDRRIIEQVRFINEATMNMFREPNRAKWFYAGSLFFGRHIGDSPKYFNDEDVPYIVVNEKIEPLDKAILLSGCGIVRLEMLRLQYKDQSGYFG